MLVRQDKPAELYTCMSDCLRLYLEYISEVVLLAYPFFEKCIKSRLFKKIWPCQKHHFRSILRQLYKRYFCHITIEKWSQSCTGTIRNGFLKDILFLGSFSIVIAIVNIISDFNYEGVELSL